VIIRSGKIWKNRSGNREEIVPENDDEVEAAAVTTGRNMNLGLKKRSSVTVTRRKKILLKLGFFHWASGLDSIWAFVWTI